MGLACGIVGLPNVGKSTLFNALTHSNAEAQNFPFCTIEPNVGIVPVADPRIQQLTDIVQPLKTIPATVQFIDIAGLVDGAAQGNGMGNQFLSHIRETDAIAQVVRCFDNDDIMHTHDKVDPVRDIDIIHTELLLADMQSVERQLSKIKSKVKSGCSESIAKQEILTELYNWLDGGNPIRTHHICAQVTRWGLLTAKPMLYIANMDDRDTNRDHLAAVTEIATSEKAQCIPLYCRLEEEIMALDDDDERHAYLSAMEITASGLDQMTRAGYDALNLHTFFTAGEKEVRAWTLQKGQNALSAAGTIHTDFQRGFIRAEVIAYDDFVTCGGEMGAREKGKWRLEGRNYIICDGDIIFFRFAV